MLALSAVDIRFEPRSGQTKNKKIVICCFSAKHAALRSESKGLLALNQDNVSWVEQHVYRGLLFWWGSCIKIKLSMLV